MSFRLDPASARQIRTLLTSDAPDMIAMCREIGEDPAVFFEGEDWSDLDLTQSDLTGVSFHDAVMDRVRVTAAQAAMIRATGPALDAGCGRW